MKKLRIIMTNVLNFGWQQFVHIKNRFYNWIVFGYWMNLGKFNQYEPKPIRWDLPDIRRSVDQTPRLLVVTPSLNQGKYLGRTIESVLAQGYENLRYVVMDGGSTDESIDIIRQYENRLHRWVSSRDDGQTAAINKGFELGTETLESNDLMAWINADDIFAPGAFHYVADYFARHPQVDVVYGNRIVIDNEDRETGRWVLPPHCDRTIRWVDYIPQETMFWRKRIWDAAGGMDMQYRFAMDWDLICRFVDQGARIVRLPHFLAAFRVHPGQKTATEIHQAGADEMEMIRDRMRPSRVDYLKINRRILLKASIYSRLLEMGLRL